MKNAPLKVATTAFITLVTLLSLFYFYSLKPKLELPEKLIDAKKAISANHYNLLQNRLGIVGLATLDPTGRNLGSEKASLLDKTIQTSEKGLENLQNPPLIKALEKNSSISTQDLFEENKRILEKQKGLLKQLQILANINQNLFNYSPISDVGRLDLSDDEERNKIVERTYNAIEGIGIISKKLSEESNSQSASNLIENISVTQSLMEKQIEEIQSGDYTSASLTFLEVFNSFSIIRESGLNVEKTLIHSPDSIQLITDQTNLLLKYEFLLKQINEMQEKLPETDFNSLF